MISNKLVAIINTIIDETDEYNRQHDFEHQIFLDRNRIQRLLYLMEIEYMLRNGGKNYLFSEVFYAWEKGPVILEVWHAYEKRSVVYGVERVAKLKLDNYYLHASEINVIKYILDKTWDWDTQDLSMLVKQTTPWKNSFIVDAKMHNEIINKKDIYNYYFNHGMFWEIKQ